METRACEHLRIHRGDRIEEDSALRHHRAPPPPTRDGPALVAIVKTIGDYILEWLETHTVTGARHVCLYDTGCTDDTLAKIGTRYASAPGRWNR
ncbi:hypothetical protein BMG03_12055 [Thioclava nitratireducens]|uniref:Uncharacterized protein n=1 Tax=Thioclava nitratireducens TaxID=1915078 RepID=A0ABM6II23_9RHOB|nr:hypothetical protein BMG03_12055 [Thioclava nitratireducens]